MHPRTLVWFLSLGLLGAGCLDLTPVKVDRRATSKARAAECFACIHAPPGAEPGCGSAVKDCNAIPSCQATLACTDQGDCYGGTRDDLTICTQDCLKHKGSFSSDMDPGVVPAGALYACITQGSCRAICFGVDDGGTEEGGSGGPENDAGSGDLGPAEAGTDGASEGACQSTSDTTIVAAGLDDASTQCGIQCLGQAACSQTCMAEKAGLSLGCAECYGDAIQCGYDQCLAPCLKTDKTDCAACTNEHCAPAVRACSGL